MSAAVVGVILNLSIWFFFHVLFGNVTLRTFSWFSLWQPELNSINWHVLLLLALSVYLLFVRKLGVIKLLAIAASLSTSLSFFELP